MQSENDNYDARLNESPMDVTMNDINISDSSTRLIISFKDDSNIVQDARKVLESEPTDLEFLHRLEKVSEEPSTLPRNENIDLTLQVLQKVYGIIVQGNDGPISLASTISKVLNGSVESKFSITVGEQSFRLPTTKLLLSRLSYLLETTIVILSTRCATQVYRPAGLSRLHIGILHAANSYEGIVTYVPLPCSTIPPSPPRPSSMIQSPLPTDLAIFRDSKKSSESRGYPATVDMQVALPELRRQCLLFLKSSGEKEVEAHLKSKKPVDLAKKHCMLKRAQLDRWKLPRDVLKKAMPVIERHHDMSIGSWEAADVSAKMKRQAGKDWTACQVYHETVESHFDQLWDEAVVKHRSESGKLTKETKEKTPGKQLRVVSVPLNSVLRKDFSSDDKSTIKDLLNSKQEKMSAHIAEIQTAMMMAQLKVIQGRYHPEGGGHEDFNIVTILPDAFEIRDTRLSKNPIIRAAPVSDDFQRKMKIICDEDAVRTAEEKDMHGLLSQDCIQYIAARLVNNIPEKRASNKRLKQGAGDKEDHVDDASNDLEQDEEGDGDDEQEDEAEGSSLPIGSKRQRASYDDPQPPTPLAHPIWNELATVVRETCKDDPDYIARATCPKGMSQSRPEYLRAMATNFSNIWKSTMYISLKRALVRNLLRVHLRPVGEQTYRDQKKKYAEQKESTIGENRSKPHVLLKAHRRSYKRLFMQLDLAIDSCMAEWVNSTLVLRDPSDLSQRQSRLIRVKNVLDLISVTLGKVKRNGEKNDNKDSAQDLSSKDVDIVELAYLEDDIDVLDQGDMIDDDDSFMAEVAEDEGENMGVTQVQSTLLEQTGDEPILEQVADPPSNTPPESPAEPSSKHLRGLEAVTCLMLDESGDYQEATHQMVRDHLFEPESYSDSEIDVAVNILNLLRPYTPKKDEEGKIQEHLFILGPFCHLANNILTALGYHDFTRRLSPVSSCGKDHPLPLTPIGICETLCAQEPGHFDVRDRDAGKVVSLVKVANKNKSVVIGAFFDLEILHNICKKHHLQFEDRLLYVDSRTIQIVGSKTKDDSVQDLWSEKKKKHRQPSATTKHPTRQQELIESGITAEAASANAQKVDATLKEKSS
ncbi:hypothetical protein EMPS_05487 [Entomortierella parvispora]|uniref:Uncharacterized protein n=1 Tax=Entomortierella parvispora TaxID=205924 RepID=A0A9P3HAJ6_9FUNG|nr:hypothetical protein EMPS_05487 [Entomortierella parvispora]